MAYEKPFGSFTPVVVTTSLNANIGTKQNIYTVPSGRTFILHEAWLYNASSAFATAELKMGYDASASDVVTGWGLVDLNGTSKQWYIRIDGQAIPVGSAGSVLGIIFTINEAKTCSVMIRGILI